LSAFSFSLLDPIHSSRALTHAASLAAAAWDSDVGQRSLKIMKMVLFESLGTVSYSPSIVTMAVSLAISGIFSVKE